MVKNMVSSPVRVKEQPVATDRFLAKCRELGLSEELTAELMSTFTPEKPKIALPKEDRWLGLLEACREYSLRPATVVEWKKNDWLILNDEGQISEISLVRVLNDHPGKRGPKPNFKANA